MNSARSPNGRVDQPVEINFLRGDEALGQVSGILAAMYWISGVM
jgi:hypothetical protein